MFPARPHPSGLAAAEHPRAKRLVHIEMVCFGASGFAGGFFGFASE